MATYEYSDTLVVDALASLPSSARTGTVATVKAGTRMFLFNGTSWIEVLGGASSTISKYHPDRTPTSLGTGGVADDFISNTPALTYTAGNGADLTTAYTLETMHLSKPAAAGNSLSMNWFTGPDGSSTDWQFSAKVTPGLLGVTNLIGISVLCTGTVATPTLLHHLFLYAASATSMQAQHATQTSYTSAAAAVATSGSLDYLGASASWYLQFRYVSSTKTLTSSVSRSGYIFKPFGSSVLAAHPTTTMGPCISAISAGSAVEGRVHWLRARSDATGTTDPYPCGE